MDPQGYGYSSGGAAAGTTNPAYPYSNPADEQKTAPPPTYNNGVDPPYNAPAQPYPMQQPQNHGYPVQQQTAYSTPQSYSDPQSYAVPSTGMAYPQAQPPPGTVGYTAGANTVVIAQPGPYGYGAGTHAPGYVDNTGAIIFSCVVSWCCCCICGIAAFVFALMADGSRTMEDRARKLLYSTRLSIAGLACGIAIWLLVLILIIVSAAT